MFFPIVIGNYARILQMPYIVTSKERKRGMLIIKDIDFSSSCFKKIRLKIQNGLTNKIFIVEQDITFHKGSIEDECIESICEEIERWTIKNCPSERESVKNIKEKLITLR